MIIQNWKVSLRDNRTLVLIGTNDKNSVVRIAILEAQNRMWNTGIVSVEPTTELPTQLITKLKSKWGK